MATSSATTKCSVCNEEKITYACSGCSRYFCLDDLVEHRESLKLEFHKVEDQRNQFMETLNDYKNKTNNHRLINEINQWEKTSIDKIRQTANEQRQLLQQSIRGHTQTIEVKLNTFTEDMQKIMKKKDFHETMLNKLQTQLEDLKKQINQPAHIQIKEDLSTIYIKKLSITITQTQGKFT